MSKKLTRCAIGGGLTLTLLAIAPTLTTPGFAAPRKTTPLVPPSPEQQFIPKARISLSRARVNIMLKNNTYAPITYQAIGDTTPRTLVGRSSILLQGLRTPVTLTLDRQDAGLLKVTPQPAKAAGSLEVMLDTTTDLGADATTLRIENTGSVFLY